VDSRHKVVLMSEVSVVSVAHNIEGGLEDARVRNG
jgi:hypothetical protein